MEHVSPPSVEPDLDYDHDEDAPLRFRRIDNVLRPYAVPGLAERMHQEELHAVSAEKPTTLEEAVCDPSWHTAMVYELRSIEDNGTWDIVDLLTGHRPIGLKWVYKAKKDEQGRVVKHKALLFAKGYVQRQGVDYEESCTSDEDGVCVTHSCSGGA
jgi:hypothetical protein